MILLLYRYCTEAISEIRCMAMRLVCVIVLCSVVCVAWYMAAVPTAYLKFYCTFCEEVSWYLSDLTRSD